MNRARLPWERAAFIRARAAAGDRRARPALPRRDPAVRLAPLARFRSDRGSPADLGADPRPFRARRADRPGLRPQARPRRHSRGRILRPDPADDPRRPRSSVRAPATLDAIEALRRGRPARRRDRATSSPTPTACCARSSTACRWSTTRRPICCRPSPRRSTMSRSFTGSTSGDGAARPAAARTSSAPARFSTASRPTSARDCPTIPTSSRASSAGSASPTRTRRARHVADWRSGKARSLRSPRGAAGVRGDAARPAAGDRRGRRSRPCAQPAERHRRAAVERRELLPPARGAAARLRGCSPRCSRTRPRWPTSWRAAPSCSKGCSTHRASRCRRRPTNSRESLGGCDARPALRRRRSTACGGWSTSAASRSACS